MAKKLTYKPFGRRAILIEWNSEISDKILKEILSFKQKITQQKEVFFTDLIVGYNSLTIKYIDEVSSFTNEVLKLKNIQKARFKKERQSNYLWEIPVCYDTKFGIDLHEISTKSGLQVERIIQLYSEKKYTVFFIGFLPGFLYLGGLKAQLFFDRKPNPRLKVAKGAVAIGGEQTGVYPSESAGGWQIIGKTPIIFFNIKSKKPCFAKAGDKIKFKPISLETFYQIEHKILENTYQLSKTLLYD